MAKPSKPSGGWVTALKSDIFTWARIKLSALYLLIIAFILVFYSIAVYSNATDHARDNPGTIRNPEEQTFYDRSVDDTRNLIFLIDGVVFIISAGLSYLLAGYTLKPIRRALEAQAEFSADASHELRTPLAVMRTGIEVLLRSGEPLPEKAQKVLRSNLEEIQSMSLMSEQLLALSRGESDAVATFKNLDFDKLVKTAVDKFEHLAAAKHIGLSISKLEPARIDGDAASLDRVLKNILANAVTYTPEGGSVTVSLANDVKRSILTITDTGIGIAKENTPHLFDRFYKADNARTGTASGSGLGLSIVKQIIDNHHGTIEIRSAMGQGTSVVIVFNRVQ